jgi:hypothetical protein
LPEEGFVQREERKISKAVELLVPKSLPEEGQRERVRVKSCEGHMNIQTSSSVGATTIGVIAVEDVET